jgi:hypothetical protein
MTFIVEPSPPEIEEILEQLGSNFIGFFWWNCRVERSPNSDLDFIFPSFASRGAPVRSRSRPPIFSL